MKRLILFSFIVSLIFSCEKKDNETYTLNLEDGRSVEYSLYSDVLRIKIDGNVGWAAFPFSSETQRAISATHGCLDFKKNNIGNTTVDYISLCIYDSFNSIDLKDIPAGSMDNEMGGHIRINSVSENYQVTTATHTAGNDTIVSLILGYKDYKWVGIR